ncbi:MAG TPA: CapA family protein [Candidatus Acidoferrales bacterium]
MDCVANAGLSTEDPAKFGGQLIWRVPTPRPIAARIAIAGDFLPGGRLVPPPGADWSGPAARLAAYFADIDTTFLNLEAAVDAGDLQPRTLGGLGDIVSAPVQAVEYLRAIRSQAVGIANNHTYDFGSRGVARTRAAIERYGMVGVGGDSHASERPDVFLWQGPGSLRVGLWAAAKASSDLATRGRRGVEPANLARGREALEEIKRRGARFCIALLHVGTMRASRPDPEDFRLMNSLAQAGFDLVTASHSHRIAGYKQLERDGNRDAFCFFGLGSLVSGYVNAPLEREGLIVVAALDEEGELVALEVRPVLLDGSGFGTVPAEAEHEMIVGRFQRLSVEIEDGSYEQEFYREVSRGLGRLYARDLRAAFRADGLRGLARKAGRVRMRHVKRLLHRVAV